MTSGDARAEGASSQIRLCRSLLYYYIREGSQEPPESFAYRPNMPVSLYMPLQVPSEPLSVEEKPTDCILRRNVMLECRVSSSAVGFSCRFVHRP